MALSASGLGEVRDSGCSPLLPSKAETPPYTLLPRRRTPDAGVCAGRPGERVACASPSPRSYCAALRRYSGAVHRSIALSLSVFCPFRSGYPFVLGSVTVSFAFGESLPRFLWKPCIFWGGYFFEGPRIPRSISLPPAALQGCPLLSGRTCRPYGPASGPLKTPSSMSPDLSPRPALPRLSGAPAHKAGPCPSSYQPGFCPAH